MNLLPVDYPLWDWQASNGNATVTQTVAAYTAAANAGLCSDFSRFVWNDLIDTLNAVLVAAGMEWDNTYTTVEEAKILVQYGALMGPAFNSVRHNIQNAVFTTWKWEFDFNREGYVGRNDFRGVSLWGAIGADRVYGWYIIELARKLNVLIEILRGTADFSEMATELQSASKAILDCRVLPSIRLAYEANAESKLSSLLKAIPILNLKGGAYYSQGLPYVQLTKIPTLHLHGNGIGYTHNAVELSKIPTRLMWGNNLANSKVLADLSNLPSANMPISISARSHIAAVLTPGMWVARMKYTTPSRSYSEAALESILTSAIAFKGMSSGHHSVNAAAIPLLSIGSNSFATSDVSAVLKNLPLLPLGIEELGSTADWVHLVQLLPLPLQIETSAHTGDTLHLDYLPPVPIGTTQFGYTKNTAHLVSLLPVLLGIHRESNTIPLAVLHRFPGSVLGSHRHTQSFAAAGIEFLPPGHFTLERLSDSGNDANLMVLPPSVLFGKTFARSSNAAAVTCLQPFSMAVEGRSNTQDTANISCVPPVTMGTEGKANSCSTTMLKHLPPAPIHIQKTGRGYNAAALANLKVKAMSLHLDSRSKHRSKLDQLIPFSMGAKSAGVTVAIAALTKLLPSPLGIEEVSGSRHSGVLAIAKGLVVELASYGASRLVSTLRAALPLPLEASSVGRSTPDVKLVPLPVFPIISNSAAFSHDKSLLQYLPGYGLDIKQSGRSATTATLGGITVSKLGIARKARTLISALLDLEPVAVPDWLMPIQTGSNLYIRQAYEHWNVGDLLYIDAELYYHPVRTDTHLHFISAYLAWQDGNEGYIDTAVYTKPIVEDGNAYIQQATLVLQNDEIATIDVGMWEDPVQVGGHLHITSDGSLGGV